MVTDSARQHMRGRTVLITGGTDGIGFHTARNLAGMGAHVLVTGRDADRGRAAAAAIDAETGRRSVTFVAADHSTVGGNHDAARQVRAHVSSLDVLVNNVGGLFEQRWETADGYEATLAMNVVGPYALTAQLLPLLRAAAPARCVNVISAGFKICRQNPFEDLQSTDGYVAADAYARAKLLNLLCSLALADAVAADQITVNAVHPGLAWTRMTQAMTPQTMPVFRRIWPLIRLVQRHRSPDKAGRRVALLASSPAVSAYTGRYFQGGTRPKRLSARELDVGAQRRALRLAAELVAEARTGTGAQTNNEEPRPWTPR
jgi:NAD(P)-dependent dehydrogenase (short-subunit alcohol dehydrogenase family)